MIVTEYLPAAAGRFVLPKILKDDIVRDVAAGGRAPGNAVPRCACASPGTSSAADVMSVP